MDTMTATLVDFALRAEFPELSEQTVHECKRRVIDTFACAVGAYDEPVSRMARHIAKRYSGSPSATVWGCDWQTTPEAAAFANGVMLRLDDISDNYRVKSGGHPSDIIAGLLAVGEAVRADGPSMINAITLAYDVYCGFCEAYDFNSKGWDQPVYGVIACALGAGKLLRLSREQMANTVALAITPNMALFQTRCGDLSSWKGCAGANASRNALFAAFLAQEGFTGPPAAFEGQCGLWNAVGRFEWAPPSVGHRIERTHLKSFPVCGHGQSAAEAAVKIHPRIRASDIAQVKVEAYRVSVEQMASDPSRWSPASRETADHSLPYVVAVGLLDGEVTPRSFSEDRLGDPAITALMRKITVVENADYSARFPEAWSCRLHVTDQSGETIDAEITHPKGHAGNPLDDRELEAKFQSLFKGYGDETQCRVVLDQLWRLDSARDVADVVAQFARTVRPSTSPKQASTASAPDTQGMHS